ncbi:hypothetical protein [Nitratireductor soli]|uniref:hypothetical protein n=1 Tax=Nitratireductor soli TaxID=1670619 RepID=UPI00065DE1FD|nr:hypothetical protein [Nitratireductor soli]
MGIVLRLTVDKTEPIFRGQDHFWRCIRVLGRADASFTASAIRAMSDEPHRGTVATYLRRLCRAGILRPEGSAKNAFTERREVSFVLVRDQEAPPVVTNDGRIGSRQVSCQQAMWNVVRGPLTRGGFTSDDLVTYGSTEEKPIARATAKRFVQALRQGNYLIKLDPGGPGKLAVWRLRPSMNTGPKPPMVLTAKLVYDQNRGRVLGETIAEEELP